MTKKHNQGGARIGAGRKPANDPKIRITIYVEESIVNSIGGVDIVKSEFYEFLKNKGEKN